MTIYFNTKVVSKVYEYFEERRTQQLCRMYPLKEMIIAELTDDIDRAVYYMTFTEKGASNYLWDTLDNAIFGSLLDLCPVNDARIINMINSLK